MLSANTANSKPVQIGQVMASASYFCVNEMNLKEMKYDVYQDRWGSPDRLEEIITIFEFTELLRTDLKKMATPESLQPFKNFLANRWQRIRGMHLAYPYCAHRKVSQLCLMLAQALATFFPESIYQLLMPTLTTSTNITTGTALNDDDLQLHHFVLSDDDSHFIEVLPCLMNAEEDKLLKHTAIFPEWKEEGLFSSIKTLSENEKYRVIHHSRYTLEYYQQIEKYFNIKNQSNSVGSFLIRLIDKLYKGSVRNGHPDREYKAAADANEGIVELFRMLDTLGKEQREQFNSCRSYNLNQDLKYYCERLAYPEIKEDDDELSIVYCVELIAGKIEQILSCNPSLYDMYPDNVVSAKQLTMDIHLKMVEEAKASLKRAILREDYRLESYPENENLLWQRILQDMLVADDEATLEIFKNLYLKKSFMDYVLLHVFNINFFLEKKHFRIFVLLLKVLPREIQTDVLYQLGQTAIRKIIQTDIEFISVLDVLKETEHKIYLIDLLDKHLIKIINTYRERGPNFFNFISLLHRHRDVFPALFKKLGQAYLRNDLSEVKQLILLVSNLTYAEINEFVLVFDESYFCDRVSLTDLCVILRSLSDDDKIKLLTDIIKKDRLTKKIHTLKQLIILVMLFQKNNRIQFLNYLGTKFLKTIILTPDHLKKLQQLIPAEQCVTLNQVFAIPSARFYTNCLKPFLTLFANHHKEVKSSEDIPLVALAKKAKNICELSQSSSSFRVNALRGFIELDSNNYILNFQDDGQAYLGKMAFIGKDIYAKPINKIDSLAPLYAVDNTVCGVWLNQQQALSCDNFSLIFSLSFPLSHVIKLTDHLILGADKNSLIVYDYFKREQVSFVFMPQSIRSLISIGNMRFIACDGTSIFLLEWRNNLLKQIQETRSQREIQKLIAVNHGACLVGLHLQETNKLSIWDTHSLNKQSTINIKPNCLAGKNQFNLLPDGETLLAWNDNQFNCEEQLILTCINLKTVAAASYLLPNHISYLQCLSNGSLVYLQGSSLGHIIVDSVVKNYQAYIADALESTFAAPKSVSNLITEYIDSDIRLPIQFSIFNQDEEKHQLSNDLSANRTITCFSGIF